MQAQRLQTGLRLCDINATMTSRKCKGPCAFDRKYRSEWEMTFVWVQKATDGSVCKTVGTIALKVCNLANHKMSG